VEDGEKDEGNVGFDEGSMKGIEVWGAFWVCVCICTGVCVKDNPLVETETEVDKAFDIEVEIPDGVEDESRGNVRSLPVECWEEDCRVLNIESVLGKGAFVDCVGSTERL
jgi:hypothetical protein